MEADLAYSFAHDYETAKDKLSDSLRLQIERGMSYSAVAYHQAMSQQAVLDDILGGLFQEYDAILTPSASGEAPIGLNNTGDPSFAPSGLSVVFQHLTYQSSRAKTECRLAPSLWEQKMMMPVCYAQQTGFYVN